MLREDERFKVCLLAAVIFVMLAILSTPSMVHADDPLPAPDNGNCVTCHEDLYFLHDTGNWFCLKESPMACVDCHGGNPNTLDKEIAHAKRAEHPVINDDTSKCEQCHPKECDERVALFDQSAGISSVLAATPYTASYFPDTTPAIKSWQGSGGPLAMRESIPLLLAAGLALGIYFALHRRRRAS